MTGSQKPYIEFNIEELVFNGFSRHESDRISSAIRRELSRLLSQGDIPRGLSRSVSISKSEVSQVNIKPGSNPDESGGQIARSILKGFQK